METAAAVEIEKGGLRQFLLDDFHRRLKKPAQERRQLFHSYHRPGGDHHQQFYLFSQRQRSTLSMLFPGPKNGEHVKPRDNRIGVDLKITGVVWGHIVNAKVRCSISRDAA